MGYPKRPRMKIAVAHSGRIPGVDYPPKSSNGARIAFAPEKPPDAPRIPGGSAPRKHPSGSGGKAIRNREGI